MNGRRTLIMLALMFAALAALTLIQNAQPDTVATPEVPFFRVFPDLAVLDMQAIRIRNPANDASFVLTRAADGTWTAPDIDGTINADAASSVARTVSLLPYTRTLPLEAGTDFALYGFAPQPVMTVEIVLVDGATHGVVLGFRTPSETGYYALVDDHEVIYLLERAPVDFLIAVLRNPPTA
jgi:hypothetical protein